MADGIVNWEEANFTWNDNSYVWSLILEIVESSNSGDAVKRKLEKLPEQDKKKFIRLIMRRKGIQIYNERKEVKNIQAYDGPGASEAKDVLMTQMSKIKNLDNIDTVVEGFVFIHDGMMYKFTGNFAPVQYLEDKSSDVETDVINNDWDTAASKRLYSAIKTLDERSQDIIETRWLADNKITLQDLADKYQVSAERVRQIEKNAMKKLQAAMVA